MHDRFPKEMSTRPTTMVAGTRNVVVTVTCWGRHSGHGPGWQRHEQLPRERQYA